MEVYLGEPGPRTRARGGAMARIIPLLLGMVLSALGGCAKPSIVIVHVPVKPKFQLPENIKEFKVHYFEGPVECAAELQKGVHAKTVNAGDLVPTIDGLPDLEGPLEVKGTVDQCTVRMGYGALNASMSLWHGGKQLFQEVVKEETNKPGASAEEVRETLVNRGIKRFTLIFVSDKRSEIREGRPRGTSDPWWVAASQGNWKLAVALLSKRVSEEPKDAQSWYNRGVAHEGNEEPREAVAAYKQAVDLERDDLYVNALVRAEKLLQSVRVSK